MKYIHLLAFLISLFEATAQNDADIYRYSKLNFSGSARFMAMGGSMGAIGSDLSAGQVNPAGFGRYSNSYFGITFNPNIIGTEAVFQDNATTNKKFNFNIPNLGVVLTNDLSERNTGDLYEQISFGVNRVGSFNQRIKYSGVQFESLLDVMTAQAAGYAPEELAYYFPFSTSVAWESYAIDFDPGTTSYYSYLNSGDMSHNRTVTTKGGANEWYLSYSRNRMNKLYWGASFSIRSIKYSEEYRHSEDMVDTSTTSFRGFDYDYELKTEGIGGNLKLGAIYLPAYNVRLGIALHTPTFSSLEDDWTATMTSRFSDTTITVPADLVPVGNYKYRLNTPPKIVGSIGYVFGMKALVNLDVEYVGYNLGRLKGTLDPAYEYYDYAFENADAKARLQSALNYRIGFEYNIQQALFLRAGFASNGNAYRATENVDLKNDILVSGGLGYRMEAFSFDLAYTRLMSSKNYYAFQGSSATINSSLSQILISASIRF